MVLCNKNVHTFLLSGIKDQMKYKKPHHFISIKDRASGNSKAVLDGDLMIQILKKKTHKHSS